MLNWRFDSHSAHLNVIPLITLVHSRSFHSFHCWFWQPYLFYVFTWRMLVWFMLMGPECLSRSYGRVERMSFFVATGVFADCACLTSKKKKGWRLDSTWISFICLYAQSHGQLSNSIPWINSTKLQPCWTLYQRVTSLENLCPKHNIQKQTLPHPSTLVAITSLPRPTAQPTNVGTFPPLPPSSARIVIRIKIFLPRKRPSTRLCRYWFSFEPPMFILWLDKSALVNILVLGFGQDWWGCWYILTSASGAKEGCWVCWSAYQSERENWR